MTPEERKLYMSLGKTPDERGAAWKSLRKIPLLGEMETFYNKLLIERAKKVIKGTDN